MLNLFDSFILNKVTFMKKNNKSNILWLIISLLTLFYTWLGYEKFWLEKFNQNNCSFIGAFFYKYTFKVL